MECHKVDRVTGAGENGKVEWPVAVTEECFMLPAKPARNTKATAQNFGTTSSTRWAGSSLCLAAASEIRASSPTSLLFSWRIPSACKRATLMSLHEMSGHRSQVIRFFQDPEGLGGARLADNASKSQRGVRCM